MPTLHPRLHITHSITMALTAIERARGFLEAAKRSEEWIKHVSQRALVLEAHHTTHIAGTHLTLEEAARACGPVKRCPARPPRAPPAPGVTAYRTGRYDESRQAP